MKSTARLTLLLLLGLCACTSGRAQSVADFQYVAPIETDGAHALYRLSLPRAVYQGSTDADLADTRIFNASGEMVPFAFYPRVGQPVHCAPPLRLPLFELPDPRSGAADEQTDRMRIVTTSVGAIEGIEILSAAARPLRSGTSRNYLLDASMARDALHALSLQLDSPADFSGHAHLESSEDLQNWHELVAGVPILNLQQNGAKLQRLEVDFPAQKHAYYRLGLTDLPAGTRLVAVTAQTGGSNEFLSHQWEKPGESAQGEHAGDYFFDSQAHFPVDVLKFDLPEPNTVAQLEIFARSSSAQAWRIVARSTVFRLQSASEELTSAPLPIQTHKERYWLVRVSEGSGGLGAGRLVLSLGWLPDQLVFVARGAAPYGIAFGNDRVGPGALALNHLIPDLADQALAPAGMGPKTVTLPAPAAVVGAEIRVAPHKSRDEESFKASRVVLWACLIAAVVLLFWMVGRLYRLMSPPDAA